MYYNNKQLSTNENLIIAQIMILTLVPLVPFQLFAEGEVIIGDYLPIFTNIALYKWCQPHEAP